MQGLIVWMSLLPGNPSEFGNIPVGIQGFSGVID